MNETIILTLTPHPAWGHILQPVVARIEKEGWLSIQETAGCKNPVLSGMNEASQQIVILSCNYSDKALMKSFSKEKTTADFLKNIKQDTFELFIRPCIENYQRKMLHLLHDANMPLYIRKTVKDRTLYDSDKVHVSGKFASAVFHFVKNKMTGLRYYIRIQEENEEEIDLYDKTYCLICRNPAAIVINNQLLVFQDIDTNKLIPFFTKRHIDVPLSSEANYLKTFVLNCLVKYTVKSEGLNIHAIEPEKKATLTLEKDWNNIPVLILNFYYQGEKVSIDHPDKKIILVNESKGDISLYWFYPDKDWEKKQIKQLLENGLEKSGLSHFSLRRNREMETVDEYMPCMIEWINEHPDVLQHFGFSQNLPDIRYFTGEITLQTETINGMDWFDVHCTAVFGEFQIPFIRFRQHILDNIRDFMLPDRSIAILPQEWFSKYYELALFGRKSGDSLRLKNHHFRLLEKLEGTSTTDHAETTGRKQKPGTLSFNDGSLLPEPSGLKVSLRHYQQIGFSWLVYLFQNKFGGCLADDMGLGKTVQTIALLQYLSNQEKPQTDLLAHESLYADTSFTYREKLHKDNLLSESSLPPAQKVSEKISGKHEKQRTPENQLSLFDEPVLPLKDLHYPDKERTITSKEHLPSLIVMPTSLLHNWQNEFRRFAPALKVYAYSGAKRIRSKDIFHVFLHYDVILTTYGTLRNDIEMFQHCRFHHLILDESQYAKNPGSQTHQTIREVHALYKIALTGTPVENALTDLWALFDIVNEGLLGSLSSFRKAYLSPINKNENQDKEKALLQLIQPFILRRTKEAVTPELPPLLEETVYCNMSEKQQHHYKLEKNKLRNKLSELKTEKFSPQMAFTTLQGLTKLRLLANHPILLENDYTDDSGKFDQIVMRFETLQGGNHKVLIFSSFVKHLRILARHFDNENWKYAWLTGSTPAENREKEIRKFTQDAETRCFFISLKAGGVGLNLTAADYVFIIDPWWNPAAEMQALSRAHRIGQNKNVMVYRFISSETIEEKIRLMQESKSRLAETFITSSNPLEQMSIKDMKDLLE